MTSMSPPPGPVSTALEADLRAAVRKHGVVAWLDADGHYTAFVDRLAGTRRSQPDQVPFTLLAYQGSHLALMLEAEGLSAGVERTALVIHPPRLTGGRVNVSPALTAPAFPSIRRVRPVAKRSLCARS